MGVPTFFLSIIKNKFYKNVHSGVKDGNIDCDYFFLDYNGIVYKAYAKIIKDIEGKNLTKNKIEELIIEEVIKYTKHLICDVVKPKKLTYIAFDGPAPRAKMVQQRSRRYKTYQQKMYMENEKKKHHIIQDSVSWDTSANISPGTEFMQKLTEKIIETMKRKGFNDHNSNMQFILSDSNLPGEGEHKYLPLIRQMRKKKGIQNAKIYIYGSDADVIILAMGTHKNNMHIIREVQDEMDEMKKIYEDYKFVDINIDNLSNAFKHDLTRIFKDIQFDKIRILNDYIFLTFLVGNDFVLSPSFLKIKKDGMKTLIAVYHDIKLNHKGYLVEYHPDKENSTPTINIGFFKELIFEVSKKEDMFMKKQQKDIDRLMEGYINPRRAESEVKLTPYEIVSSRYIHLEVCSPDHPLFQKYHEEFKKIDYEQDYEIWKEEFYKYYLNISKKNEEEYLKIRIEVVQNYLESLMFNLKYYFQGVPSWQWHYKFRISPLLSDIYYVLDNSLIDINNIQFTEGKPYTPFQQLMLILPPQLDSLVPSVLRPIMNDDKLLCTQFYPVDFRMDVSVGLKTQYSEAILPEIDEELLINTVKKYESKLSPEQEKRNLIREKPVKV